MMANFSILAAIGVWFSISMFISSFNKYFFGEYQNKPYSLANLPLFSTGFRNIEFFIISGFIVSNSFLYMKWKFSRLISHISKGKFETSEEKVKLVRPKFPSLGIFFRKYFACSLLTAIDIGMADTSLRFLTLSMYIILKSSTPIFVLIMAHYCGFENLTKRTFIVIVIMCIGMVLMGMEKIGEHSQPHDTKFYLGYFLAVFGSVITALRWGLTQYLINDKHHLSKARPTGMELKNLANEKEDQNIEIPLSLAKASTIKGSKDGEITIVEMKSVDGNTNHKEHPHFVNILFILTPTTAIFLLTASLILERPYSTLPEIPNPSNSLAVGLIGITGFFIFFILYAEYWILEKKGIVFLSVCNVLREVLVLIVAAILFGDSYNAYTTSGLILCLLSIIYYNYLKVTQTSQ